MNYICKEELKNLLMKVRKESEKVILKLNIQKTKIMASSPITSLQIDGEKTRNSDRFYLLGFQNHCRCWLQPWKWKAPVPWKKSYDGPRQHVKTHTHHFADKGLYSQICIFSSSHVWMWQLDHREGLVHNSWYFQTVVLKKTLESPSGSKEIKPDNPKEISAE